MNFNLQFFFNSIMLGIGLAMDAFSVSMANGLNYPTMSKKKMNAIAGVFAGFQALMPMIGWFLVHSLVSYFKVLEGAIPWIALILLGFIGGKLLQEGISGSEQEENMGIGLMALTMQGIATSIDALSVGFTISDYNWLEAIICALIIAIVTFGLCIGGLIIGKKFGTKLAGKSAILGGVILILIGLEIFIKGIM